jgi:hypothetical protein
LQAAHVAHRFTKGAGFAILVVAHWFAPAFMRLAGKSHAFRRRRHKGLGHFRPEKQPAKVTPFAGDCRKGLGHFRPEKQPAKVTPFAGDCRKGLGHFRPENKYSFSQ